MPRTYRKESVKTRNSGLKIPRGGGTPYNGLYGEALPRRVPFSGLRYING